MEISLTDKGRNDLNRATRQVRTNAGRETPVREHQEEIRRANNERSGIFEEYSEAKSVVDLSLGRETVLPRESGLVGSIA